MVCMNAYKVLKIMNILEMRRMKIIDGSRWWSLPSNQLGSKAHAVYMTLWGFLL